MRVVGGVFRGRTLRVPPGKGTRPTTERVREALFDVLGASVQGQVVLDLYAGSGSLGIEALSRGAERVVFVEMGRVPAEIIQANLAGLHLKDPKSAHVLKRPVERSFDVLRSLGPFDLCLIDPPFAAVRDGTAKHAMDRLIRSGVMTSDSTVILEYPSDQPEPAIDGLALEQLRMYGDTRLAFFGFSPASQADE